MVRLDWCFGKSKEHEIKLKKRFGISKLINWMDPCQLKKQIMKCEVVWNGKDETARFRAASEEACTCAWEQKMSLGIRYVTFDHSWERKEKTQT